MGHNEKYSLMSTHDRILEAFGVVSYYCVRVPFSRTVEKRAHDILIEFDRDMYDEDDALIALYLALDEKIPIVTSRTEQFYLNLFTNKIDEIRKTQKFEESKKCYHMLAHIPRKDRFFIFYPLNTLCTSEVYRVAGCSTTISHAAEQDAARTLCSRNKTFFTTFRILQELKHSAAKFGDEFNVHVFHGNLPLSKKGAKIIFDLLSTEFK